MNADCSWARPRPAMHDLHMTQEHVRSNWQYDCELWSTCAINNKYYEWSIFR